MQEGAREVRVVAAEEKQARRSAIRAQPHFSLTMGLSSQLQLSCIWRTGANCEAGQRDGGAGPSPGEADLIHQP